MNVPPQQPGIARNEIDTPALVIDLPVMEDNINGMAKFAKDHGIGLRPYIKTHKSPVLAQKQMAAGAIGAGCATVQEAELMADAGIKDLLIGNQVMGPVKIARLMNLAKRADVIVAVDSIFNVDELSKAANSSGSKIRVLVEVDVGAHRCGVLPGQPALKMAQYIAKSPGLEFCGFMGYESHLQLIADPAEKAEKVQKDVGTIVEASEMARKAGLNPSIISASGSLTYKETGSLPGITEIQPGTYIFMDARYYSFQKDFKCALSVLATVISRTGNDYMVVDAGHKALSSDGGMPVIKDIPGANMVRMWEEHGKIEFTGPAPDIKVGEKIEIYPTHVCTTVNLHGKYFAVRNDRVEAIWEIFTRHKAK
jgi:D-serine deaminase-like pyridoxal phosphate-dependent protein